MARPWPPPGPCAKHAQCFSQGRDKRPRRLEALVIRGTFGARSQVPPPYNALLSLLHSQAAIKRDNQGPIAAVPEATWETLAPRKNQPPCGTQNRPRSEHPVQGNSGIPIWAMKTGPKFAANGTSQTEAAMPGTKYKQPHTRGVLLETTLYSRRCTWIWPSSPAPAQNGVH